MWTEPYGKQSYITKGGRKMIEYPTPLFGLFLLAIIDIMLIMFFFGKQNAKKKRAK